MLHLGKTELSEADFKEVIRQMSESSYKYESCFTVQGLLNKINGCIYYLG
jgi:hypothetical protein